MGHRRQDIVRTLKEGRYCSTMFDYYGMPIDWPGRKEAVAKKWNERARYVEERIRIAIVATMGGKFDPKYFIPYVQLHEFESLAFADIEVLASVLSPIAMMPTQALVHLFSVVLAEAGNPEAIDDGHETCPSRRIARIVRAYKKRAQGPIVTSRIGMDRLRLQCPHFGEWLARLEQLNAGGA